MADRAFDTIKAGMEAALAHVKGQRTLTVRDVTVPEPPKPLHAQQIAQVRKKLNVSQSLLAKIMNTSVKTVQSWEQGTSQPSGCALRMLAFLNRHPDRQAELAGAC